MKRRSFISASLASLSTLPSISLNASGTVSTSKESEQKSTKSNNKVLMHVGSQRGPTDVAMLKFFKTHGVNNICGRPINAPWIMDVNDLTQRKYWTLDELKKCRDMCEKEGISLDMVTIPLMSSSSVDQSPFRSIVLGNSPERDRDIEHIQTMIAHCAEVGIPAFKYNLNLIGVLRTAKTPGRGSSMYTSWDLDKALQEKRPMTRAGTVDADTFWERIDYFLNAIIPVCNEYQIRAACHPHDPGVPAAGFQGVQRVLGDIDGLKRFVSMHESPFHGLNFCVGSVAEMLEAPAKEINEVVNYFATRNKIFNIHMRNIRGSRNNFQEVHIDDGDLDIYSIFQVLQASRYQYMIMPDHVPSNKADPGRKQGFAHAFGYIQGCIEGLKHST